MSHQKGLFIVSRGQNVLQAVDAATGMTVWEQQPARSLEGAVGAVTQGRIVLLYLDGHLEARNALDGAILWAKQLLPNANLPPGGNHALASQTAVALMYGKTLTVVRPADGTLLWSYRSSADAMSLLTVTDEHLYMAETSLAVTPSTQAQAAVSTRGALESHRALSPSITTRTFALLHGTERWLTTDIPVSEAPSYGGTPLIEDGETLYVCASSASGSGLYALETQTGNLRWKVDQPLRHRFGQLVTWHEVVVWNSLSLVTAFDRNTRHILWQEDVHMTATAATTAATAVEEFTRIIINGDRLHLGRRQSTPSHHIPKRFWIEARDPRTGIIQHTFPDSSVVLDPNDARELVYTRQVFALPSAGSLYAFDPTIGSQLWTRDFGPELAVLCQVQD